MTLTSAQLVSVREYMGYSVSGDAAFQGARELVYSDASYAALSLDTRLANLSSDEENRIVTFYLPNLQAREQDLQDAATTLDTAQAAVWTRNPNEMSERRALFSDLRRRLCAFLGFAPGRGIGGSNRLVRA